MLELLSSAMYVDPLSIYREYVQNAADAIDDARAAGSMAADVVGRVDITIDPIGRGIVIRDNGAGIPVQHAERRLLAIGASTKRGTRARGFRGVGRLAGLAYGRTLTFRTRSLGDDEVIELRWDCQRLKAALRDVTQSDDIGSVIERVVSVSRFDGADWPTSFFEVEVTDVVRTKRDALLSPAQVAEYLEQVAPIPFDPALSWGPQITEHLASVRMAALDICIGDLAPLRRPLRDTFNVSDTVEDRFDELELLTATNLDGEIAAVGWVLHHGYRGSITIRSRIGGMRCRVGNVQIGGESLLEEIFPETRFDGWSVGEVHVLDPRIVPNARRDHFEQNLHFSNLTAQLEPVARRIAQRARSASIERNNVKRAAVRVTGPGVSTTTAAAPTPDGHVALDAGNSLGDSREASALPRGRLSASQQQALRRLRGFIRRNGLSLDDVIALVPHL